MRSCAAGGADTYARSAANLSDVGANNQRAQRRTPMSLMAGRTIRLVLEKDVLRRAGCLFRPLQPHRPGQAFVNLYLKFLVKPGQRCRDIPGYSCYS